MRRISFPCSLYLILDTEEENIIRWEPNGKSFKIVDSKRFETESLPKHFKHANYASIQRQLNLHGFRCVRRNELKGVFFHPLFTRGNYDNVKLIKRIFQPRKRLGKRSIASLSCITRSISHNSTGTNEAKLEYNGTTDEDNDSSSSIEEFGDIMNADYSSRSDTVYNESYFSDQTCLNTNNLDVINDEDLMVILNEYYADSF